MNQVACSIKEIYKVKLNNLKTIIFRNVLWNQIKIPIQSEKLITLNELSISIIATVLIFDHRLERILELLHFIISKFLKPYHFFPWQIFIMMIVKFYVSSILLYHTIWIKFKIFIYHPYLIGPWFIFINMLWFNQFIFSILIIIY